VDRTYVGSIERSERNISADRIDRLAAAIQPNSWLRTIANWTLIEPFRTYW